MIVLEDVHKVYPNGTQALNGVSLEIPEREFAFLVGPQRRGQDDHHSADQPRRDRDHRQRVRGSHRRDTVAAPRRAAPAPARGRDLSGLQAVAVACRCGKTSSSCSRPPTSSITCPTAWWRRRSRPWGSPHRTNHYPPPTVGRRAAAHGHRPRAGAAVPDIGGRRADGKPRSGIRLGDHPAARPAQRAGHHGGHRHAQPHAGGHDAAASD